MGYGIAGRCGHRGRAARRRPTVQASRSAGNQEIHEACGATVEKSRSASGTEVEEAGRAPKGAPSSHLSPGDSAPMEGGPTTGI